MTLQVTTMRLDDKTHTPKVDKLAKKLGISRSAALRKMIDEHRG